MIVQFLLALDDAWQRYRDARSDYVSPKWLHEREQHEQTRGLDSITWRWPVPKKGDRHADR